MKKMLIVFLAILNLYASCNSDDDTPMVEKLFKNVETDEFAYIKLQYLCKHFSKRITGSETANHAVKYMEGVLKEIGADTVYLQSMMVPRWERGDKEIATLLLPSGEKINYSVCALGGSISTSAEGIKANVISVESFDDLEKLGKKKIEGKIVFFSKPMNPNEKNTFRAYGEVAGFRVKGATFAAKYGAVAVLIRSLTTLIDENPHTGIMHYDEKDRKIPAFSICTKHANELSDLLKQNNNLELYLKSTSKQLDEVESYNVIAEVKGNQYPDEIITIGGHLDCWDLGEGAHDDGAGCLQSADVLRQLLKIGYKPKRTIRVVMFMDEETAQRGGRKYAELAKQRKEKHLFALEADRGASKPLGFTFDCSCEKLNNLKWKLGMLKSYGITNFDELGGGVDIGFLKDLDATLSGFYTDPEHYFDFHHSANDSFDKINKQDFQKGIAAMASIIYLVDKYGLN